jgi:hypothetical protein
MTHLDTRETGSIHPSSAHASYPETIRAAAHTGQHLRVYNPPGHCTHLDPRTGRPIHGHLPSCRDLLGAEQSNRAAWLCFAWLCLAATLRFLWGPGISHASPRSRQDTGATCCPRPHPRPHPHPHPHPQHLHPRLLPRPADSLVRPRLVGLRRRQHWRRAEEQDLVAHHHGQH